MDKEEVEIYKAILKAYENYPQAKRKDDDFRSEFDDMLKLFNEDD